MSIRISEEDLDMIHRKAHRSLLTLTEYVTTCCLGKQIVVIDGLHHKALPPGVKEKARHDHGRYVRDYYSE